jgi:hypothetical protein
MEVRNLCVDYYPPSHRKQFECYKNRKKIVTTLPETLDILVTPNSAKHFQPKLQRLNQRDPRSNNVAGKHLHRCGKTHGRHPSHSTVRNGGTLGRVSSISSSDAVYDHSPNNNPPQRPDRHRYGAPCSERPRQRRTRLVQVERRIIWLRRPRR